MNDEYIKQIIKQTIDAVGTQSITLNQAKLLAEKVEKEAARIGVKAVVAIAGSGANIVCVECMDDSYLASYDIAVNKTYTCIALKMSTKELKPLAQPGASLYGIQFTNGGKIVVFGGGVPLKNGDKIIGAIGVSGGTEEQDTYLAEYGEKVFMEEIL